MDPLERRHAATSRYRLAGLALVVLGAAAGTPLIPAVGLLLVVAARHLAGSGGLEIQPVADAAHGDKTHRLIGIGLELRAEPGDVDVDRPRIARVIGAPDAIEQLPTRVDATRMRGQQRQQAQLLGPEVECIAVAAELVRGEVQDEPVPEGDEGLRGGAAARR